MRPLPPEHLAEIARPFPGGFAARFLATLALAVVIAFPAASVLQAQGNDPSFDASVSCPAYAQGAGPRLLIDEAHRNLHTAQGRYAAFAQVAKNDGYRVEAWTKPFAAGELPEKGILVIANARGEQEPTDAAFQPGEIQTLRKWVEGGGSLFLIADHAPFGTAAQTLAEAFGVRMIDGHVRDPQNQAAELPGPFFLEFTPASGLLGDHAILRGRSPGEKISRVVTFGGQALSAGPPAVVLLRLGAGAESVADPNNSGSAVQPVGGTAQAVAVEVGKGRVVVAGEAGIFGAQIISGEAARRAGLDAPLRFGMNHPGTDDRQFLLNALHWLSGLLAAEEPNSEALARKAIAEASRAFSEAYVKNDSETLKSLYTEDALLLPPGREIRGRDAAGQYFRWGPRFRQIAHAMTSSELTVHGGMAVDVGTWHSTSQRGDEPPSAASGAYLVVWVRGADGKWRMKYDMWHRPAAEPARSPGP